MISKTVLLAVSGVGAVQLKMDTNNVSIDIADSTDGVIDVPRVNEVVDDTQNLTKSEAANAVSIKVANNNEKEDASLVVDNEKKCMTDEPSCLLGCGLLSCFLVACIWVYLSIENMPQRRDCYVFNGTLAGDDCREGDYENFEQYNITDWN